FQMGVVDDNAEWGLRFTAKFSRGNARTTTLSRGNTLRWWLCNVFNRHRLSLGAAAVFPQMLLTAVGVHPTKRVGPAAAVAFLGGHGAAGNLYLVSHSGAARA